ncbi:MAG: hypothetical protein MPJ50_15725 [Pirellulales bacterium]|nr:hypothetical protein [Pirellulales bacterium]
MIAEQTKAQALDLWRRRVGEVAEAKGEPELTQDIIDAARMLGISQQLFLADVQQHRDRVNLIGAGYFRLRSQVIAAAEKSHLLQRKPPISAVDQAKREHVTLNGKLDAMCDPARVRAIEQNERLPQMES